MKNKNILVTGGAGFIGSHLVDKLVEKKYNVSIIDDLSTGHIENVNKKAGFYKLNINDPKIETVFKKKKAEVIFLLACNTIVPKSVVDPIFDIQSLTGNLNIMTLAKQYGIKKIIMSSSGFVYGNTKKLPTPENAPIIPDNPYIITKSSSEKYLEFFHKTYGIKYVILRYATVYGPRQTGGAMADYIRCVREGRQAVMYGDGKKTRDYVYIEDVINANILALNFNKKDVEPVFNIGTGKETTLNQLYGKICATMEKKSTPNYLADRPGEMMRFKLSTKKAREHLGWQAKVDLDSALQKMILNNK